MLKILVVRSAESSGLWARQNPATRAEAAKLTLAPPTAGRNPADLGQLSWGNGQVRERGRNVCSCTRGRGEAAGLPAGGEVRWRILTDAQRTCGSVAAKSGGRFNASNEFLGAGLPTGGHRSHMQPGPWSVDV